MYQLQRGVAVETWRLMGDTGGKIVRLRVLKDECFRGESSCGRFVVAYNGSLSGKSNFDDGTGSKWLRFEVRPKKNCYSVVSVVQKLYPLLEKEKDALEIMECLSPLLNAEAK